MMVGGPERLSKHTDDVSKSTFRRFVREEQTVKLQLNDGACLICMMYPLCSKSPPMRLAGYHIVYVECGM